MHFIRKKRKERRKEGGGLFGNEARKKKFGQN